VEVHQHYDSAPYTYIGKSLDIRVCEKTIEIFFCGHRITSHQRDDTPGKMTTQDHHCPRAHREHANGNSQALVIRAQKIGPATEKFIDAILHDKGHFIERRQRRALGILRLVESYSSVRLEAACQRAMTLNLYRYQSIESILKNGLDKQPLPMQEQTQTTQRCQDHHQIRGAEYYH